MAKKKRIKRRKLTSKEIDKILKQTVKNYQKALYLLFFGQSKKNQLWKKLINQAGKIQTTAKNTGK